MIHIILVLVTCCFVAKYSHNTSTSVEITEAQSVTVAALRVEALIMELAIFGTRDLPTKAGKNL